MAQSENTRDPVAARIIARNTLVVLGILIVAAFFWVIKEALLVAFAGVILAVILTGLARQLRKMVPVSKGLSLAAVCILILMFMAGFGLLFGSQIVSEFEELTEKLPEQAAEVMETVRGWPMGDRILESIGFEGGGSSDEQPDKGEGNGEDGDNDDQEMSDDIAKDAGGMLFTVGSTIASLISTVLLIFGTGIFFAISPDIYKNGIVLLFPRKRADRIHQALETSGNALWKWVTGQFIAMLFVGITITIGLMILGVPLAIILGFIAGVADFVPIVGPIAAAIPAILLAFSVSPETALYTTILFVVIQQIEGNVVTPLLQKRMVSIPPAVVLLSIFAFGLVFGIPGVILATPLAVIGMVLIGMFYVQDVLGKEISIPGEDDKDDTDD